MKPIPRITHTENPYIKRVRRGVKITKLKSKSNYRWYYFYCHFGPGHQSHDEGFRRFPVTLSKEAIEEAICEEFSWTDDLILYCWPAELTKEQIDILEEECIDHIGCLEDEIQEERLKTLELNSMRITAKSFVSEDGDDPQIHAALKGRPRYQVVKALHDVGIFVTCREIRDWCISDILLKTGEYKAKKPPASLKAKILKAIKSVKPYEQ